VWRPQRQRLPTNVDSGLARKVHAVVCWHVLCVDVGSVRTDNEKSTSVAELTLKAAFQFGIVGSQCIDRVVADQRCSPEVVCANGEQHCAIPIAVQRHRKQKRERIVAQR